MSRIETSFTPQVLRQNLKTLPACKRLLVGFSGGADSSALLLALHQLSAELECRVEAIHFNHGLQDSAAAWEQHCRQFCFQRVIPLRVIHLNLQRNSTGSFETAARQARYQHITQLMTDGDIYLTAHQADDQAETLFINLLRGSGGDGLAGIPELRRFSRGWLARPLLNVRREALESWLSFEQVSWITDGSNLDQSMDRNYLRGCIFPLLEQRWPGIVQRLNQSAEHLRDRNTVIRELLARHPGLVPADGITLDLKVLDSASQLLQAEVIRNWVRENNAAPPPRARLHEFLQQLQGRRPDSQTELRWSDWLIKQHGDHLWMHEFLQPAPCPGLHWDTGFKLELGVEHGYLSIEGAAEIPFPDARVSNRSAISPELKTSGSAMNKIKNIMRISGIPPWLRDTIPILFVAEKLYAIGDWWLAPEFAKELQAAQLVYRWQPRHVLLKKIQAVSHNSKLYWAS